MITPYEYILLPFMVKSLYMPENPKFLGIEECGDDFCLKAEVNFDNKEKEYRFVVITSGQELPFGFNQHLFSIKRKKGGLMFHVFQKDV